tara:strand:+ start:177 stop:359 length:183 start_codon:yes stop_codon:yes gene_type:complete
MNNELKKLINQAQKELNEKGEPYFLTIAKIDEMGFNIIWFNGKIKVIAKPKYELKFNEVR